MPSIVAVDKFMTKSPHGIDPHQTLETVQKRMHELKVRHMPVRSGGLVIGVISDRDLATLASCGGIDFKKTMVGEVMTPDPYSVRADAPVADVARQMADMRIGSALVLDGRGRLAGIFTETDALLALADIVSNTVLPGSQPAVRVV